MRKCERWIFILQNHRILCTFVCSHIYLVLRTFLNNMYVNYTVLDHVCMNHKGTNCCACVYLNVL